MVALENQRYGRNKSTLINSAYIESGEYRRKFDNLTPNDEVNRVLYAKAKEMLKHRSGTLYEDMYWIDGDTGKIIAREINSETEQQVIYSNATKKSVASYKGVNLIAIHNHPSSMPPSMADFNSCCRGNYNCGYIACHNGKLYGYRSDQSVSESLYNLCVGDYLDEGLSEDEAQIKALEDIKRNHDIDFWEVF